MFFFRKMESFRKFATRLVTHPVAVSVSSFGVFLTTFAVIDFNREVNMDEVDSFNQRDSRHLGESLEQLHTRAFENKMTFNNIKVNRSRCAELFFLYKRAELKKKELRNDDEFRELTDTEIEALVAEEFNNFGQRMCRRAMIRNGHVLKWAKAMMQDEFIKFYVLPVGGFFLSRYFRVFDGKK